MTPWISLRIVVSALPGVGPLLPDLQPGDAGQGGDDDPQRDPRRHPADRHLRAPGPHELATRQPPGAARQGVACLRHPLLRDHDDLGRDDGPPVVRAPGDQPRADRGPDHPDGERALYPDAAGPLAEADGRKPRRRGPQRGPRPLPAHTPPRSRGASELTIVSLYDRQWWIRRRQAGQCPGFLPLDRKVPIANPAAELPAARV